MLTMDKAVDQFGYEMCCAKELRNNYLLCVHNEEV